MDKLLGNIYSFIGVCGSCRNKIGNLYRRIKTNPVIVVCITGFVFLQSEKSNGLTTHGEQFEVLGLRLCKIKWIPRLRAGKGFVFLEY